MHTDSSQSQIQVEISRAQHREPFVVNEGILVRDIELRAIVDQIFLNREQELAGLPGYRSNGRYGEIKTNFQPLRLRESMHPQPHGGAQKCVQSLSIQKKSVGTWNFEGVEEQLGVSLK